jgi:E3 ubiquitin-protein ligase SIAH1
MLIQEECPAPELESSLLNQLECPECNEYMRPPIILCERGCKVCENWKSGYSYCKICDGCFVKARSLALENLARRVKYPCKYRSYGCTEIFSHDRIDEHQVECLHIPRTCPFSKLNYAYCSWSGSYDDIKGHLQSNHLEDSCEYVEGYFKFVYSLDTIMKFFAPYI